MDKMLEGEVGWDTSSLTTSDRDPEYKDDGESLSAPAAQL
jgi:hypothetical protein